MKEREILERERERGVVCARESSVCMCVCVYVCVRE